MDSGNPPSKPSSRRNRLSLILQLGSPPKGGEMRTKQSQITDLDLDPTTSVTTAIISSPLSPPALSPPGTPASPLRSPPVRMNSEISQPNARVSTTVDSSSSGENMKLLKKARKLSRVFIGAPVRQASIDPATVEDTSEVIHPPMANTGSPRSLSRSNSHTKRRKLTRNRSIAEPFKPSSSSGIDLHRLKSLLSPRPVWPSLPSISTAPADCSASKSLLASSVLPAADDGDQCLVSSAAYRGQEKRSRFARLSRHFEENASSTPPANDDVASPSVPTSHATSIPRRVTPGKAQERRRRSLDLSALAQPLRSPSSPNFSFLQRDPSRSLKRSRSMWARGGGIDEDVEDIKNDFFQHCPEVENSGIDDNGFPGERPSERQRSLNVRRAKKMVQLFGSEPPPALFQITNMKEDYEDESITPIGTNRQSLATLLSVSAENPTLTSQPRRRADTGVSCRSLPTNISEGEDRLSSDISRSTHPLSPACMSESDSRLSSDVSRTGPTFSPGGISANSSLPETDVDQASIVQPTNSSHPSTASLVSETSVEFQMRRRRAAKLSRFFGVGYQDLSSVPMSMSDISTSQTRPSTSAGPYAPHPDPVPLSPGGVDATVNSSTGFWEFRDGRNRLKEIDPEDVIGRLRELRAAT